MGCPVGRACLWHPLLQCPRQSVVWLSCSGHWGCWVLVGAGFAVLVLSPQLPPHLLHNLDISSGPVCRWLVQGALRTQAVPAQGALCSIWLGSSACLKSAVFTITSWCRLMLTCE